MKEIKKSYELLKKLFVNVYMEFDNQELDTIQEHNVDPSTRRGSTHLFGWKTSYHLPSMERIMITRRIKFIHFTQFGVIGMCRVVLYTTSCHLHQSKWSFGRKRLTSNARVCIPRVIPKFGILSNICIKAIIGKENMIHIVGNLLST